MTEKSKGWRAGILAVCTAREGWWNVASNEARPGPALNEVVRVRAVYHGVDFGDYRGVGLEFDEFPDEVFATEHFRKIEPDTDPADDAEIIDLITGKRVGVPA
ncbi:MAG: hypothetical protein ACT6Q5_13470 [Sphingopyxis solisilvae]|uniref:hypothetical protein n=1 Tax=Sphingopyxis solisilvae TaxID=1886788 RepID=UPI0040367054